MKIPSGMTEEEVLSIIKKVSRKYRKFTFAYLTSEDIEQECFIFALEGLDSYTSGPLENFLSRHIKYRLINLKRKLVKRTEKESNKFDKIKQLIVQPIDINSIDESEKNMFSNCKLLDQLSTEELMEIINRELSVEYRMEFLKYLSGAKLPKFQKTKIIERIREIVEKYENSI